MKKLAFGLFIMFMNINVVYCEPSAFFSDFKILNGEMSSKFTNYNDTYVVYLDDDQNNLIFDYELVDEDASIIIKNNDYVNNGDEVLITVTSSDDEYKTDYSFYVYKNSDDVVSSFNGVEEKLEFNSQKFDEKSVVLIIYLILVMILFKIFFHNRRNT